MVHKRSNIASCASVGLSRKCEIDLVIAKPKLEHKSKYLGKIRRKIVLRLIYNAKLL